MPPDDTVKVQPPLGALVVKYFPVVSGELKCKLDTVKTLLIGAVIARNVLAPFIPLKESPELVNDIAALLPSTNGALFITKLVPVWSPFVVTVNPAPAIESTTPLVALSRTSDANMLL